MANTTTKVEIPKSGLTVKRVAQRRNSTTAKRPREERTEENDDYGYISLDEIIEADDNPRNTIDPSNRGEVISRHEYPQKFAVIVPASVIGEAEFRFVKKSGKVPAHRVARILSAQMNLRNELEQNPDGSIVGEVTIKVRKVTREEIVKVEGKKEMKTTLEEYLYFNLSPLPEGTLPEFELLIDTIKRKPQSELEIHFGPTIGTYTKTCGREVRPGKHAHSVVKTELYAHFIPLN